MSRCSSPRARYRRSSSWWPASRRCADQLGAVGASCDQQWHPNPRRDDEYGDRLVAGRPARQSDPVDPRLQGQDDRYREPWQRRSCLAQVLHASERARSGQGRADPADRGRTHGGRSAEERQGPGPVLLGLGNRGVGKHRPDVPQLLRSGVAPLAGLFHGGAAGHDHARPRHDRGRRTRRRQGVLVCFDQSGLRAPRAMVRLSVDQAVRRR